MTRFCPNCGTETDESALFCPSCGQPVDPIVDEAPSSTSAPSPAPDLGVARTEAHPRAHAAGGAGGRMNPEAQPPPAGVPRANQIDVPVTWPVTLSGWLIGVGAIIGALGTVIGLFGGFLGAIDLILLLALIAIAATVFFSGSVPAVPHLKLITLVVVLIGFGIALDRIGFGRAEIGALFVFLGTAAAAIGAIILELGRDQPLGGPGT